jgi:hypothetical protein
VAESRIVAQAADKGCFTRVFMGRDSPFWVEFVACKNAQQYSDVFVKKSETVMLLFFSNINVLID